MNLYVVRHGQVPSNVEGIVSGWNDEELTDKGILQANEIRNKLQNIQFDVVYSSPINRAKQTAMIVAPQNEILYDSRLAEREPGTMLGQSRKNIDKSSWNSLEIERTPEGAETLASGLKRVRNFLDEINQKDKNKNVLIITHNFISKCIWILENGIKDTEQINSFFHNNDEIKHYNQREQQIDGEER